VLKGAKLIQGEKASLIQVNTPYDPAGFDVPAILRQMMFSDISGGRRYCGLLNRYQHFADLSDHLNLRRALLWGLVEGGPGAAEVRHSARPLAGRDDRHWTMYRFVLPVEGPERRGMN
jgi:hypothetical protein